MKYATILLYEAEFSIAMMCRVLLVGRSAYYRWRHAPASRRAQARAELTAEIKAVFEDEKGRAGSPRITKRLRAQHWRAKAARKFKATTNSHHKLPVAPNLLAQHFEADAPNKKWVSDITYIWTDEGWLYLAVVMDLYSRLVVGWSMSERMTTSLVSDALTMALWRRQMPKAVIVHSDRGSQYCSHDYQKLLADHHLICSMSKKGDCYDNAAMESWNHSLKVEAIHGERFTTRNAAKAQVFEFIDVYYNRKRLHSKLGYLNPEAFEAKQVA